MTGKNDDELKKAMAADFARYRAIGTRSMGVRRVRVEPIDTLHALAHVQWRTTYDIEDKAIDVTNVYLTRMVDGRAQVFGRITGDEDAEVRNEGIIG